MAFKRITAAVLTLLMITAAFAGCQTDVEKPQDSTSYIINVDDTSADSTAIVTDKPLTNGDSTTNAPAEDTTSAPAADTTVPGTTVAPEVSTSVQTEPSTTDKAPDTTDSETTGAPVVTASYSDLIFKQVYGTGENNDTPIRYSFIQIFNTAAVQLSLKGIALSYISDELKSYSKFNFADNAVIPASGSYLIRCAEAKDADGKAYNTDYEKIRIEYYDASWDRVIDNKEVKLAITKASVTLSANTVLPGNKSVYAYYIGTQSVSKDINTCTGISKQKAAYRDSAKDAKFGIVEYKTASASKIADCRPMYSGGDRNTWLSATANVVSFSQDTGFYDSQVSLKLSALDGYTIYYTTNGKDPRKDGTKYSQPLNIGSTNDMTWGYLTKMCNQLLGTRNPTVAKQLGARTIKAYATNGKVSTQVVTKTYFVGIKQSDYDVPFLSMSIEPDEFLSRDKGVYYTYQKDIFGQREHKTAYLEMYETDGSCVSSSYIQIAISGNGSTGFGAKSMKIYFDADAAPDVVGNPSKLKYDIFKGQAEGVGEYKRLLLRNSGNDSSQSHLRDGYMQALLAPLDCPYMAYRPSLLFINGEFWGVYNIRERFAPSYYKEHFGIQSENLVMLESPSPLIDGSWNNPYVLNDGEPGDEKPYHELMDYVRSHDLSVDQYYNYVADRIDVSNMIDFLVGSIFLCNTDWPGNNIKVWRNKNPNDPSGMDTKWRFGFCDMDMGTGLATNIDTNMMNHATQEGTQAGMLFNRMFRNKTFRQKFIARFYECADTIFDTSVTLPLLKKMAGDIDQIMPLHFNRWPSDGGSVSNWNANIRNIEYFMTNRKAKALEHMEAYFGIQPSKINISMNMAAADIYVGNEKITQSGYTQVFSDSVKLNFKVEVKPGYEYLGIKTVSLSGISKTYTTSNVSVTIDEAVTVVVMTRKTGFTTAPAIVTGSRSVFVLDKNGNLYAWGENNLGQNCVLTSDAMTKPILVMTGVKQVATSMGGTEGDAPVTAILTETGEVYTVGNNSSGQLGRSGETTVLARADIDKKIVEISAGLDHLVVLDENGVLYGVGNNVYGQLGEYKFTDAVREFTKIAENVKTAAAGRRHTVFITTDGKFYALGDNRWSKFSSSAPETITTPVLIAENMRFVSTGQHNCLVIDNNNDLYYCGWRDPTTFGAGNSTGRLTKIASGIDKAYVQDEHIVMLGKDGKVYGSGNNNYMQISDDGQQKAEPTLIWENCIAAGAGTYYSAAIGADGNVMIRGNNKSGVLGKGSINSGENGTSSPMNINK